MKNTLALLSGLSAGVMVLTTPAFAKDIDIYLCGGPIYTHSEAEWSNIAGIRGMDDKQKHAYTIASEIFADAVKAAYSQATKGQDNVNVKIVDTRGAFENVELVAKGRSFVNSDDIGCDMGFSRSDVIYNVAQYMPKLSVTSPGTTFVAIDDSFLDKDKDPDSDLMSDELFREYPQLLCHRDADVRDIKDLKRNGTAINMKETNKLQSQRIDLERRLNDAHYYVQKGGTTFGSKAYWEAQEKSLNTELQAIKEQLAKLEGREVTIAFLAESGMDQDVDYQFDGRDASSLWKKLVELDYAYGSINTTQAIAQNGSTAYESAFSYIGQNKNACVMVVDRVGQNTVLQGVNDDTRLNKIYRIVALNDWDFDDAVVADRRVYVRTKLKGKQVYPELRSKRPDGAINMFGVAFFQGTENQTTLAVKTKLVTSTRFMEQISKNYVLMDALKKGVQAIKSSPRLRDPLFADEFKAYVNRPEFH